MKKKLLLISLLIVIVVALVCFCGCKQNTKIDMTGKTAVVYELEGGKYKNCTGKITQFYDLTENESNPLIFAPDTLSKEQYEKPGYEFNGWFKKKIVNSNPDFCPAVLGEFKVQEDDVDGEAQFVKAELPLEEEKAYYLQIEQTVLGKNLYAVNGSETVGENVLMATTDDIESASNVYVELTQNGCRLYFLNGEDKEYLSYKIVDGKTIDFVIVNEDANEFVYDEERGIFRMVEEIKLKGKLSYLYYFGTMEDINDTKYSEAVGFYHNIESVSYSNEWDFNTDRITSDGVTLYAKWSRTVKYTYVLCYDDETTGERKRVTKDTLYEVNEGDKFNDYLNYKDARKGWTSDGVYDSEGNPWNADFRHPGGEQSTAIEVVVKYIKGTFTKCSTAEQLIEALSNNSNCNIYLENDIDCNGAKLKFGNYMGQFRGNGYTVSNFEVDYNGGKDGLDNDNLLNASIFGNAYKAEIHDVTFDNVILDYSTSFSASQGIVIGVLGSRVSNVTISNVTVSNMTITISKLPTDFDIESDLTIVTDELCAEIGYNCEFEGKCSVENIIVENKVEENK